MIRAQEWFNGLPQRQQVLVAVALLLLAVFIGYYSVWRPLALSQERLSVENQRAHESLLQMQQLAAEYKQLSAGGATVRSTGNLSRIVDTSVARHQLVMKRYQPSSNGGAQVRLENVVFSQVIGWLHELESEHAIVIRDISFTDGSATGLVNVSVRLSRAE